MQFVRIFFLVSALVFFGSEEEEKRKRRGREDEGSCPTVHARKLKKLTRGECDSRFCSTRVALAACAIPA